MEGHNKNFSGAKRRTGALPTPLLTVFIDRRLNSVGRSIVYVT